MGAYCVLDEVWEQLWLDHVYAHCFTGCWATRLLLERTDSWLLPLALRRWSQPDCVGRVVHRVHAFVPFGFNVSSSLAILRLLWRCCAEIACHVHVKHASASSEADILCCGACGLEGVEVICCDLHPLSPCKWSCDHLGELKLWSGCLEAVDLLKVVRMVNCWCIKREVALTRPQIKERLLALHWLIRRKGCEWCLLVHGSCFKVTSLEFLNVCGIGEDLCVFLAAKLGRISSLDSIWKTDCTVESWVLVQWCIY